MRRQTLQPGQRSVQIVGRFLRNLFSELVAYFRPCASFHRLYCSGGSRRLDLFLILHLFEERVQPGLFRPALHGCNLLSRSRDLFSQRGKLFHRRALAGSQPFQPGHRFVRIFWHLL